MPLKRKFNKEENRNWQDEVKYKYKGKPDYDYDVKDHISVKSLKDLPHSSYALKADPYEAAMPESQPYQILNKFNRVIGGNYEGEDNIDGGNVQQYSNSQVSKFLKIFDEMRLKINANYRYLPVKPQVKYYYESSSLTDMTLDNNTFLNKVGYDDGDYEFTYTGGVWKDEDNNTVTLSQYGITVTGTPTANDTVTVEYNNTAFPGIRLIDEMRKSVAESVSLLQSTTFTQMAINNFAIETDMPMGSATPKDVTPTGSATKVYAYTDKTDVIYGMSIYYQIFLQNILNVMNWHNSFRLKQGVMIRNAWEREVPNLNSFFGLMNKKAFLSMLDSINLSFEGEYIDREFMEQMNMLTVVPSRRSDAMTDPILELQCGFNKPSYFKVYILGNDGKVVGSPFFDDADLYLNIPIYQDDGTTINRNVSIWEACDVLRDLLSMENTQKWARSSYVPGGLAGTDNRRYNQIKNLFDVIISSFTLFKPKWSDFREAFDVMVRTGTISWTKGFRPSVTPKTNVDILWNVLIDHIYQLILSGSHELNYDEQTKRWRTFSLWNMYSGVPSYDMKSGGAFLSLSFKEFGNGVETSEQFEYLPLIFEPYEVGGLVCEALARDGSIAKITQYHTVINNNVILSRLAPLASQSGLEIRVPTVDYDLNSDLTDAHRSHLYKMLTQIFGLCRIQATSGGSYDYALDPDILAIYQIEVSDITNMSITYARANAPFRGTTSRKGELGFSTISKK